MTTGDTGPARPIAPFETMRGDHVLRPLVYFLQHSVLPDLIRNNHPVIYGVLTAEPVRGMAFFEVLSRTKNHLVMTGVWSQAASHAPAGFTYCKTIMDGLSCTPTPRGNWIVAFDGAAHPLEADLIGIRRTAKAPVTEVRRRGQPSPPVPYGAYPGAESIISRYFTLERTADPTNFAFCEWADGVHANGGFGPRLTVEAFEDRFMDRCR